MNIFHWAIDISTLRRRLRRNLQAHIETIDRLFKKLQISNNRAKNS